MRAVRPLGPPRLPAAAPLPHRELVAAIRAELAGIEPARQCCRRAALAGLAGVAGASGRRHTSPAVDRLAHRLASVADFVPLVEFDWPAAAQHCRLTLLRGLFLARGSLSLAAGRTHLEFVVPAEQMAQIGCWLAEMGLPVSGRLRRGRGVLTAKSAETVIGFLRRAGGTAATLELETLLVKRSLRAHLNRVVNAESANLRRSVASSRRQLATVVALAASGELERLPAATRAVARARLAAPEASFSDLAVATGLSRAHVQRALAQIEERALHAEERHAAPAG